jgi:hypothetical protein
MNLSSEVGLARVATFPAQRRISHNPNGGAPPFAGWAKGGQETVTGVSRWEVLTMSS